MTAAQPTRYRLLVGGEDDGSASAETFESLERHGVTSAGPLEQATFVDAPRVQA